MYKKKCRQGFTLCSLSLLVDVYRPKRLPRYRQVSITKPLSVFKEDIVNAISGNCGAKHTIYMSDAQCTDPEHSGCRTVFGTPAGPSCALLLSACRCQCGTVATTPTTTETTTPSIPATSPEPTTAVTTSALKKCRPHIAAYLGSIHGTMYAFRRFLIFVRATYHSQYPNAEQFFKKQITHLEEVESELENALALNGITMSSMTLQTDINEMNLENFEIRNNEAAGAVKVTDDVKAHIIDLVKHKDILWKVKSRGYKLDAEKSAAYLEISNQVNELHSLSLKGEDIQNIFKNLKDSYMRRLKSAKKAMGNTGDGAKSKKREDKFIFADELEFLLENESDLDISRRVLGMGSQDLYSSSAQKSPVESDSQRPLSTASTLSLSSAVEDDLDDAFNNEIHTPIRKRRREQRSSRADEELASVLRTLAEENKKNKYEHFADEVACCLKTVEDRNPTLALDMKRQIQEVCYNFEKKSLDLL
ncbi:hypothetical protein QR680_007263 [Steinernema hermaphroditum]|uniref:MADF domain-containing protein n=1 Tax=Steinernema hermaphroditum TaxID=289476 RepID=A0AA39LYJ8_9BILA|nr:hypothetical protein QR680_007263 [Steinernema hermaphroditum]